MVLPGWLALIAWIGLLEVIHCVFGTWYGLQWADLGHSLWGAPLEVGEPLSLLGCAPLELDHTDPVR